MDVRLDEIQKRLSANDRKVKIYCTDEVKDYLGNAGYSPAYGARPLARLIEKEVLNRLAVLILRGSVRDGEVARVVLENGRIEVLANHEEGSEVGNEDEYMGDVDGEDAVLALEDGEAGMDLYD